MRGFLILCLRILIIKLKNTPSMLLFLPVNTKISDIDSIKLPFLFIYHRPIKPLHCFKGD